MCILNRVSLYDTAISARTVIVAVPRQARPIDKIISRLCRSAVLRLAGDTLLRSMRAFERISLEGTQRAALRARRIGGSYRFTAAAAADILWNVQFLDVAKAERTENCGYRFTQVNFETTEVWGKVQVEPRGRSGITDREVQRALHRAHVLGA